MISEETLVRLLDMNPFSNPKLCRQYELPVFAKIALIVWQALAVYTTITVSFKMKVFDIESFVFTLSSIYILISTLISSYLVWSPSRVDCFNLEELLELSSTLDVPSSTHSDIMIPIMICLLVAHVSAFTYLAQNVFIINYLLFACTNYTLIATKRIVSKRIKAVIDKMVQKDNPIEVVHNFRQVLTQSQGLEDIYFVSVLIGLTGGLFMILISLSLYWKVYGLLKTCDCFESKHPFVTIFSQYYAMCQLLLLGLTSTQQQINVSICGIHC